MAIDQILEDRFILGTSSDGAWIYVVDNGVSYRQSKADFLKESNSKIQNLEENQYSGVVVYETLASLPVSGVQNISYKVSNDDINSDNNGYYHWNGSVYIKDYNLVNGVIEIGNIDAVSGNTVFNLSNDINDNIFNSVFKWKQEDLTPTSGQFFNGASIIENGFTIPIGSTGLNSFISKVVSIVPNTDGFIQIDLLTGGYGISSFDIRVNLSIVSKTIEVIDLNERYRITIPVNYSDSSISITAQLLLFATTSSEIRNVVFDGVYYFSISNDDKTSNNQNKIQNQILKDIENNKFIYKKRQEINITGQVFNGAFFISNGFTIPIGSTGLNSFLRQRINLVPNVDSFFEVDIYTSGRPISHFALRVDLAVVPMTVTSVTENEHYNIVVPINRVASFVDFTAQLTTNTTATLDDDITISDVNYFSFNKLENKSVSQILIDEALTDASESEIKYNNISVSVNGNTDFVGINSIQDAIDSVTDASFFNRYVIEIDNGYYYVLNSSEYKGFPGNPAMVAMKDYVSINGESEKGVIIHAELPFDDVDIDTAIDRVNHQTLWNFGKEANVTNLTLVAKNIRYAIHMDAVASSGSNRNYENVTVVFEGTKGFVRCFGLGVFSGESNALKNIKLISSGATFSCHGNTNLSKTPKYSIEACDFFSQGTENFVLENSGSIVPVEFNFINNNLPEWIVYSELWLKANPSLGQTYFNHAETKIKGYGNTPILFANVVQGDSLLITTKTIGNGGSVSFDETSTAFNDLIKDRFVEIGAPIKSERSYFIKDGYYVMEGSTGKKAFAFGCVDLSESAAAQDGGINYRSMGKRLGDCSTVNKTLGIIVNSITYNIVFNQNYTALSNAVIVSEIQTVISAVADVSFYNYGREYYHEFTDCVEMVKNGETFELPKGTIVNVDNGRAKLSNEWNNTTRVLLDNIPIVKAGAISTGYGTGRSVKKAILYTNPSTAHYARAATTVSEGNLLDPVNGVLTVSANGNVKALQYGLIKINN